MSGESLENMLGCTKAQQERKTRPHPEEALKCPRCESSNTKFCYYNNYSLSQPRYFCKSCRRYWTKGGTLRNVPVGGGCRKNKRSSSKTQPNNNNNNNHNSLTSLPHHHLSYDTTDCDYFTLPLPSLQKQSSSQLGYNYTYNFNHNDHDLSILGNPTNSLCDILAQSGLNPLSIRNGFLETQNSLHSLYSVCGSGDTGEVVDNGNSSCGVEMMVPYDQSAAVTNVKQESEMKMLEGSPWQLNGATNMGELNSGRPSWNNTFTSSWHALLHSPLM